MIFKGNTLLLNIIIRLYPSVFHRRRRCNMFVSLCSRLIYFHRYLKGTSTVLTMILPVPMSMPAVIFHFLFVIIGPTTLPGFQTLPAFMLVATSISFFWKFLSSYTERSTNNNEQAEHFCPALPKTDMTIFIIV